MFVVFHAHDELLEHVPIAEAGDLHGSIGSWSDDPEPAEARRRIGFRVPPLPLALVGGFPRTAALSTDGRTWTACDLRDAPE